MYSSPQVPIVCHSFHRLPSWETIYVCRSLRSSGSSVSNWFECGMVRPGMSLPRDEDPQREVLALQGINRVRSPGSHTCTCGAGRWESICWTNQLDWLSLSEMEHVFGGPCLPISRGLSRDFCTVFFKWYSSLQKGIIQRYCISLHGADVRLTGAPLAKRLV